jgi:NAD(P)H-nitrite reductase large subunit
VPRIAAGEVTPDGLIAIGKVAKKYGLYTKVDAGRSIFISITEYMFAKDYGRTAD